ncbi:cytochrome P450 [Gongronella butleri]|nr:cytochrome P450 [Gongronella butleri]
MSQLLNQVAALKEHLPWTSIVELYEKHLAKYTDTRGKRVTIGLAVSMVLLGRFIYDVGRPPKHLRRFPYANRWTMFKKMLIDNKPLRDIFEEDYRALAKKGNGVYVKFERAGWGIQVTSSAATKQILMKGDIFPKNEMDGLQGTLFFRFLGVSNIVFAVGQDWKKHRKVVNPAFHRSNPVKLFGDQAIGMFNMLDEKYPADAFKVDAANLFERLTLDIIALSDFCYDFGSIKDENSYWKTQYDKAMEASRRPLYLLFPKLDPWIGHLIPSRRRDFADVDAFTGMLSRMIDEKRAQLKERASDIDENEKDLLTLMIESEMRGEGELTKQELLNDLGIFFIAGHDTTAISLSSAIYWLARYPDVQQKARDEVNRILFADGSDPKADVVPNADQLKQLVYLNQIIKEALRLGGPVVQLGSPRKVQKDVELAGTGVILRKGERVNINLFELHHSEDVWDKPFEFNPDRYCENGEAEQNAREGLAWAPFSNGSRQCIGMNFSLTEQRVILSMILRRYDLSLPEDSIHKSRYVTGNGLILKPRQLDIVFKKRF